MRAGFLGPNEVQRIVYYRDLAAQFRGWAEDETNQEARDRLLEERMAALEAWSRFVEALVHPERTSNVVALVSPV